FRRSPVVRDLFLDICRTWGRAAQTFSEMHELGLLGRYLPEFGALTCLVQYDAYHKFSADQHSLLAVEHLEALAPGQSAESEGAAHVLREVEKPELLMLGMLVPALGPGVLTPWQARIPHELSTRTPAALTGGRVAKPSRTKLAERLHAAAKREVDLQAVKAHLAMMADRYLESTSVQRMAEHLRLLGELGEAPVVTALFQHPDLGSSALVVVTRDLPGLFSLIAGTLAASGVNIISAQIHTRADGVAIDTFQVNDPAGDVVGSAAHWARPLDALRAVLPREQSVGGPRARRRALRRP